jgi:hypothetical protein
MIYDLVNGAMDSLINRWGELRQSLKQLKDTLFPDQADGTPTKEPTLFDLDKLCSDEQIRIRAAQPLILSRRPAIEMFAAAIELFILSDAKRKEAGSRFEGRFSDGSADDDLVEITVCRGQLERLRVFIATELQEFEEITSVHGERFNVKGIRGSVEKLAAYPILTSDLNTAPISAPAYQTGAGGLSLQKSVECAMREVLGRLPKSNDPRSFVVALNQSFQIQEVEGHVEINWTPRSYAGQTDLGGGVTGGQASLYTRAKIALDNSLPLLEGLYPLLPEADPELTDAARAIVRNKLTEVVNELGVEGGPRIARVDDLFKSLLEENVTDEEGANSPDGYLGYLKAVFGLSTDQINTLEEETNVTNFIVLKDYVTSLNQSWISFRDDLFGKDLGTRLVLLSRALSVAAESVGEVYAAMDSVFVGAAERQVAAFRDQSGKPILIEELLSWIVTFTSEEAPRLIYEGGRRGVAAIVKTVQLIEGLTSRFIQSIPHEPTLPEGLRHPRVLNPLLELRAYLERVLQLSQDVSRR